MKRILDITQGVDWDALDAARDERLRQLHGDKVAVVGNRSHGRKMANAMFKAKMRKDTSFACDNMTGD
jgi:hypothetical protein